jgi:predicted metal-dependent hydrolase
MKVRFPKIDFSKVRIHWAPNPEFAQSYNAFSTVPAHIEPYLVKVMMKARKVLDPKHADLHREMDIFIKQEVQHCKQHMAFNQRIVDAGYTGMLPIEVDYKADYERFLASKSLRFNIVYAEGFESMGSSSAQVFFEDLQPLLAGADPEVVDLWAWHLAEEFEHRETCYKLYKTLYGNGVYSYLYRLYGFFYALTHIRRHTERLSAYLIGKDREGMNAEQLAASLAREKAFKDLVKKASLRRLKQVLSPWYNPARRVASPGMEAVLARF